MEDYIKQLEVLLADWRPTRTIVSGVFSEWFEGGVMIAACFEGGVTIVAKNPPMVHEP